MIPAPIFEDTRSSHSACLPVSRVVWLEESVELCCATVLTTMYFKSTLSLSSSFADCIRPAIRAYPSTDCKMITTDRSQKLLLQFSYLCLWHHKRWGWHIGIRKSNRYIETRTGLLRGDFTFISSEKRAFVLHRLPPYLFEHNRPWIFSDIISSWSNSSSDINWFDELILLNSLNDTSIFGEFDKLQSDYPDSCICF